jgi:ABC-2 type transport system ATP-binding protein
MTPIEYLNYCADLFELPKHRAKIRVQEVIDLVDLDKAKKRRIGGFSGGMIQRMGIAQALVHSPPVLFLDEPTSALDPAGRYEVLDLISRLRGEVTVFLSSHILTDIERICDTIAILRSGELVLVTPREKLLNEYVTSTVVMSIEPNKTYTQDFLVALKNQLWMQNITLEGSQIRVVVDQVENARLPLLKLIADFQVPLIRYEWVRPTLEEIFLKLSA